jgi:hypothetical protein
LGAQDFDGVVESLKRVLCDGVMCESAVRRDRKDYLGVDGRLLNDRPGHDSHGIAPLVSSL